jgi:hypothetical protein
MIKRYLSDIDTFISTNETVADVTIIRRDVRDTGMEKTALYRYRLKMDDESIVELTERIVEERGQLRVTKYRFHWQDKFGNLVKRWDNAPHHPEIETFPNHLHDGAENNVVKFQHCSSLEMLMSVIEKIQSVPK